MYLRMQLLQQLGSLHRDERVLRVEVETTPRCGGWWRNGRELLRLTRLMGLHYSRIITGVMVREVEGGCSECGSFERSQHRR